MQSTCRSEDDKVVKNGEGNDGSEVVDDAEKNQQKNRNAEFGDGSEVVDDAEKNQQKSGNTESSDGSEVVEENEGKPSEEIEDSSESLNRAFPRTWCFNNGFEIKELEQKKALPGKKVQVRYSLELDKGRTIERNRTLNFRIGAGGTIPCIDEGIVGMQIGDKRSISTEAQPWCEVFKPCDSDEEEIPQDSVMTFIVEMLSIE